MADLIERLRDALGDRYRIDGELGRGGMAIVYRAHELRLDRAVALKVLLPELASVIGPERFEQETRRTARLTHPHILPLLDSGTADGLPYYTMPLVGETLRARLDRERQLPLADITQLATDVAEALEYSHQQGIVHRDIKPENILLANGQAVVADFGIARAIDAAAGDLRTATGVPLGTPAYMSPEQASASRVLDGRSDQYSLACVTFEMVAGRPPFVGPDHGLLYQHTNAAPPSVTTLRPGVPANLDRVLARALAKSPADRFASTRDFVKDFAASVRGPERPPIRTASRYRTALAVSASIVLLAAVFILMRTPIKRWMSQDQPSAKRQWILVAEFEGPADDLEATRAARDLVSVALDQSLIVTSVTPDQMREVLRTSGRPADTRVTAELARELAYRSSVRSVVAGRLGRLGNGYTLALRVVDVERDSLIVALQGTARGPQDLIPTVERLAGRLRAALGERPEAIRATRPMEMVATPSFEAYRNLVRFRQLVAAGITPAALAPLRRAIALDPDFAGAYRSLGTAYRNLGMSDSARWAYTRAAQRPERLRDVDRFLNQSDLAFLDGDLPAALAACDAAIALDSTYVLNWNRRCGLLGYMGRFDEGLRSAEEFARRQPFGPTPMSMHQLFVYRLQVGDYQGAGRALEGPRTNRYNTSLLWLFEAQGRWSSAESLAVASLHNAGSIPHSRWNALRTLAAQNAARGQVGMAMDFLRQSRGVDAASIGLSEDMEPGQLEHRTQILLARASGIQHLPPESEIVGQDGAALITRGLHRAAAGDVNGAMRLAARLRSLPSGERAAYGAGPVVLDAFIAGSAEQWGDVIRILDPVVHQGEVGVLQDRIGMEWPRWLMAEAWEGLDHPDSAAAYFERLINAGGDPTFGFRFQEVRLFSTFAHQRLVLLYLRMGRLADAERHWNILNEAWTNPDPELLPLIGRTQAALASAKAAAAATQR